MDAQVVEIRVTGMENYQQAATTTAVYPGSGEDMVLYPVLGLVDEACEVAGVAQVLLSGSSPVPGDGDHRVLAGALDMAVTAGAVLGQLKKAHRDDGGAITAARRRDLLMGLEATIGAASRTFAAVQEAGTFGLPPLRLSEAGRDRLAKEVGDVVWYVSQVCTEARLSMGAVAQYNVAKLARRMSAGTIQGSGDDR